MPRSAPVRASWYDYPAYYDLAFQSETQLEADFIEAACRHYCPFPVKKILEPACGTGRLVAELARRGYEMQGFDVNRPALDFAQRRLRRRGLSARLFEADLAAFEVPHRMDAAICTFDSFRHLLSEEAARRHLECVARSVRPGGIYILGLHLIPPDADPHCIERWTERNRSTSVTVTLRVVQSIRRRRIERIRISVLARRTGALATRTLRLRDEFDLRLYSAAQFRRLLASVPELELRDVFDFWYEIDSPLKLNNSLNDSVFVLQRR